MLEQASLYQRESELLEPEIIGDVSETAIHVLKSGRPTLHGEIQVKAREDADGDRRYMLILDEEKSKLHKPKDHFLSQRLKAKMALIGARLNADGTVTFSVPDETQEGGYKSVTISKNQNGEKRVATLHDEQVHVVVQDSKASELMTNYLGIKALLVAPDPEFTRYADPNKYGEGVKLNGFADGAPYSIGVEDTRAKLFGDLPSESQPDMLAFRPNVSIKIKNPNIKAGDEDSWSKIQIGGVIFKVNSAGVRCAIPDVNQHTGRRTNRANEVLRDTRAGTRTVDGREGVFFAVNATPLTSGEIGPGAEVKLLARNAIPHWQKS